MHAGEFDVFRDGVFDHFAVVGHGVEFDFLGVLQELRHDDGIFLRHFRGQFQERVQLLGIVAYVHRGARKHVGGTDQHRVADLLDELVHFVHVRKLFPCRLVDAQLVEHARKLVPVLGPVDRQRRGAQHRNVLPVEPDGQIVRNLSAHRHDDAFGHFEVQYVEYAFERQLVEIEPVAHVVVGRYRFGIVVDHDRLVAELAGRLHGIDRTPVEFDGASDAIGPRSEHDHRLVVLEIGNVVVRSVVGHVEVVGQVRIVGSHRVDAFDRGKHAGLLAGGAHPERFPFEVPFRIFDEAGDLEVGESEPFGLQQYVGGQVFDLVVFGKNQRIVVDVFEFVEEPRGDFGQLVEPVDRVTLLESLGDGEDAQVRRMRQLLVQIFEFEFRVADESVHALSDHAQAFLDDLLERLADGHDFADRFHARSDFARYADEFAEVPARYLAYQVVELRSDVGRIGRTHFSDPVERIAQGQLRGDERQRIARRLGGEGRRTAQPCVHLDDAVVVRFGVERVLDVALAHDADVADDFFGEFLQHRELAFVQRAGRRHDDALAGVDAQRVEVLHAGYREAVVVAVADHLELDLFPAFERFFDQNLLGIGERTFAQRPEFVGRPADAAAQSAQRVGGADHDREPDPFGGRQSVLHRFDGLADRRLDADFVEFLDEQVAVFGRHDRVDRRAQHLDAVFPQRAVLRKLRPAVQRGLPAEGEQDAVGSLLLDNFLYETGRHGQEIDPVRDPFGSLYRRDIRIDEHRGDAFFFEGLERLRAGVVELARLPDLERARTEHDDFLDFLIHGYGFNELKSDSKIG